MRSKGYWSDTEIQAVIDQAVQQSARERPSSKRIEVLTRAGIDGKLTGADVVISVMAMGAGAVAAGVLFVAKLLVGYSVRAASGCAEDVLVLFVFLVLGRLVADILSIPSVLGMLFESPLVERRPEPQVVRDPVFINRNVGPQDPLIGLPNGETIRQSLVRDFLGEAIEKGGTAWSREHWCNKPDDPKRPGKGVMEQDQWNGLKALLEESGVWRTKDRAAVESFLEGF